MSALRSAFTLVEVILAILIISAIMSIVLYFYQRSVEVRQNVLQEAEFLSVSRMLMEQLTSELRTARIVEDQFIGLDGSSNSISFICTAIPQTTRWIVSSNEPIALPPATDLKRVTYRLLTGSGTNALEVRGIDRMEEMLTTTAFSAGTNSTEFVNAAGTNVISESEPNLLSTNLLSTNDVQLVRRPLTDRIKLLQFRYWGGTNWLDSWNSLDLPAGVEITIGAIPAPPETASAPAPSSETTDSALPGATTPDDLPPDFFRRVVYLPNSVPTANKITNAEPAAVY